MKQSTQMILDKAIANLKFFGGLAFVILVFVLIVVAVFYLEIWIERQKRVQTIRVEPCPASEALNTPTAWSMGSSEDAATAPSIAASSFFSGPLLDASSRGVFSERTL